MEENELGLNGAIELGRVIGRAGGELRNIWIRQDAVLELLFEKGIITKDEYKKKSEELFIELKDKIEDYIISGNEDIYKE